MAEKFIKILQDGRPPSFIPDNKANREFWAKQNAKVAGSHFAQKEIVTIVPASAEENEMLNPVIVESIRNYSQPNQLEAMQAQLAQQQELINKLLLGNFSGNSDTKQNQLENQDEGEKIKGKPGPKPKEN